jgi:tetratricopeptide (TPR) repeat protein
MDEKLREALDTGRELYTKNEYERAQPYLAQVAAANVNYADVFNMLGVIHHEAGQFSKAQSNFEEALRINPAYTEAALNLSVTYNDMGQYAKAKQIYQNALQASTNPGGKLDAFVLGKLANMYADIAEVFSSSGCHDEAIAEYRRALGLRPSFIDLRVKLAQVLRDAGQGSDALRELKTALAQDPLFIPARIHYGITLFIEKQPQEALLTLQGVLEEEPDNSRARMYLNMIQSHSQRTQSDHESIAPIEAKKEEDFDL